MLPFSRSALFGLFLAVLQFPSASAFLSGTKNHAPLALEQPRSRLVSWHATVQDQDERMTMEDEEVLFGEADKVQPPFPAPHRVKDRKGNILVDRTTQVSPLDHAKDPLINKLRTMRDTVESCPELWSQLAQHCPDKLGLLDEHLCDETVNLNFGQLDAMVQKSASVFVQLGVTKGTNVAVLGENSAQWLLVDQGIQRAGGASAVRGADAPLDELRYIYEHSDSARVAVLQGPKLLTKLAQDEAKRGKGGLGLSNKYGSVRTIILMHREKKSNEEIAQMVQDLGIDSDVKVAVFSDLVADAPAVDPSRLPQVGRDDLATIVYTSGTTGRPKGVMLTHGNLLHQTGHRLAPTKNYEESEPLPGEKTVSLLPVWHITERTFEMWVAARGCSIVYSSIRHFKNDLAKHKPEWLVLVPRVLEKIATGVQDKFSSGSAAVKVLSKFFTSIGNRYYKHKKIANGLTVGEQRPGGLEKFASRAMSAVLSPFHAVGNKLVWSKVQDGFGGNVKVVIAGGSALAGGLETFYETAGIPITVGYGLTECSPLLSYRRQDENLVTAGCAGKACLDTEVRVVDPESLKDRDSGPPLSLPIGEVGVVIGRGPQVMKGYYKNPEATAKAIDRYGWFDTGDLGRINPATGDLILTGRAKDTIVLSNGENIEPTPIEDAIIGDSHLIDQVMVTGQDGRRLVAVAVLNPNAVAKAGFLSDKKEISELQEAAEKVNDPKICEGSGECDLECEVLAKVGDRLRSESPELKKALMADIQRATASFRKWEQVGDVYLTLEPFAMSNGLLTQSYKVKRAAVMDRYQDVLP